MTNSKSDEIHDVTKSSVKPKNAKKSVDKVVTNTNVSSRGVKKSRYVSMGSDASKSSSAKSSSSGKASSKQLTNVVSEKKLAKLYKWKKSTFICATLIGICILTVVAVFLLNFLATPVAIVIWTVVIVFLLRGVVNFFEEKGLHRALGTAIAYLIMFAVIALICVFMFSPAIGFGEQMIDMLKNAPKYMNVIQDFAQQLSEKYSDIIKTETFQKLTNDAMGSIAGIGSTIASTGLASVMAFGSALGSSFMAIGIALVIAFWLLMQLPAIGREFNRFVKDKYRQDVDMWHYTFTHVMAGYIKGTFLQCLIIGIAAGILFWALGISNSAALGCITGVMNIIPIIGPWIGGLIAAIAGIGDGIWIGVIALAGTIGIQSFVYTFISPKIMSDSVDIHPALSLFALTVGAAIGGAMSGLMGSLVGMLLSIPFVAVFKSLFVYYYEKNTGRQIVSEDGVFFKGVPTETEEVDPMYDALAPDPQTIEEAQKNKKSRNRFLRSLGLTEKEIRKIRREQYPSSLTDEEKKKYDEEKQRKQKEQQKQQESEALKKESANTADNEFDTSNEAKAKDAEKNTEDKSNKKDNA